MSSASMHEFSLIGRVALVTGASRGLGLAMASSLATALGIVSYSMGKRVAEEVRKYGANLVIIPETAPAPIPHDKP